MDVVWLKRDVRLHDQVPLATAVASGRPFMLLFLYEPDQMKHESVHGSHVAFVNEGLQEMEERLRQLAGGSKDDRYLTTMVAEATEALEKIHNARKIGRLLSHQETGHGVSFARDKRVSRWCRAHGVEWQQVPQSGVVRGLSASRSTETAAGTCADSLWYATWLAHLESFLQVDSIEDPFQCAADGAIHALSKRLVVLPPAARSVNGCDSSRANQPSPKTEQASAGSFPTAQDLGLPADRAGDRPSRQKGGESEAMRILADFLQVRGERYSGGISSPNSGWTACSRLSPYLAWGHISLRTVWQNVEGKKLEAKGAKWKRSLQAFIVRLQWRCNYCQRFEMRCWMETKNLCPAWEQLQKDKTYMFGDLSLLKGTSDKERLDAFENGRTGYPMVDACMRCLLQTGWLNFRMRCMLVSFAIYNLWLDWRSIAGHLARCFLDYEPGIHYPQLQMQAGTTGCDLRCYSVLRQAKDQDPKGEFIRKYIPELRGLPGQEALEPWKLPVAKLQSSGAASYPPRIVDEAKSSKGSKTAIAALQEWFQVEGQTGKQPPPLDSLLSSKQQKQAKSTAPKGSAKTSSDIAALLRGGAKAAKRRKAHGDGEIEPEAYSDEDAEHEDGEFVGLEMAAAQHASPDSTSWSCPRCTLINSATQTECDACCGPCPKAVPESRHNGFGQLHSGKRDAAIDLDD
eukprot:TRINITY_DN92298_c0_g1_i1.p1 TRINITY_DN92298_c0_g1~~TRINITY_DN92298_c0_g1_i1.p1  ORF type:complete len:685 (+),score=97.92 TRINITY_DN92298_c0_g1_i1:164-2218(+)